MRTASTPRSAGGWLRTGVEGAAAGAVATVAMSAVMLAARRAGLMGRQPPEKITDAAADATDADVSGPEVRAAATAAHLGFGSAMGSLFALTARRLPGAVPRSVPGAAFGLVLWAVSYGAVIPSFGVMPTPPRDRRGRPAIMVAAHVVYGLTVEKMLSGLRRLR